MRMLSQGRMSELFSDKTIKIDQRYRTLGFARNAKKSIKNLSNTTYEALIAFADGVNAYTKEKMKLLPYEFYLLNAKFEEWTPLDSQTLLSFYFYDLHSDWRLEYYKTEILQAYGKDLTNDVFDTNKYWNDSDYPCILNDEDLKQSNIYEKLDEQYLNSEDYQKELEKRIAELMKISFDFIGHATLKGSNSWVIGGQHTQSGKPILSNDPHLDNYIPSIWYSTQLIFGKNQEHFLHGATMPGIASLFLGRSNYMSWGSTTINTGDNSDLYFEKLNEDRTQHLFEGKYYDLEIINEIIKIKGQKPFIHKVRVTKSGRPIVSDFLQKSIPNKNHELELSLQIGSLDENDQTYEGMMNLIMTNSWNPEKIRKYAAMITQPNQNLVFATIDNHVEHIINIYLFQIGYYAISDMRKKNAYVDDGYIKDGTSKLHEQLEKIPANEKPFVFDPPKGYIVSSNQKFATNNIKHHKSYNAIPYTNRAYRINEIIQNLINSSKKITAKDMMKIQADYLDTFARKFLPLLLQQISLINQEQKYQKRIAKLGKIINLLKDWDYQIDREQPESSIYMQWIDFIYARFWNKIENEKERKEFQTSKYLEHYYWYYFTKNFNNTQPFVLDALEETVEKLETIFASSNYQDWKWKEIHYQYYKSPTFTQIPLLKYFFERKTPAYGNQHTPSVAVPNTFRGSFYSYHSGNYKAIFDMNYKDKSYFIIDSGISENIFSKHYDDQLQLHKNYEFIEMQSGYNALQNISNYHQVQLNPK